MNIVSLAVISCVALFLAMLGSLEVGFRIGRRDSARHTELAYEGIGVLEAALFALFGLLLAFSFSGAMDRLNSRRQLIVQETNAIGTAYLRLDVLPAADQPEIRGLFKRYVEARVMAFESASDPEATTRAAAQTEELQNAIWAKSQNSCRGDSRTTPCMLLIPALNEMIDVTTARRIALNAHLPNLILALLVSIAILTGLLAGYAMSKRVHRSWLHITCYAAIVTITLYTVIDLDYPRAGLINVYAADQSLKELRDAIK
jgi:hypothetical protein